MSFGKHNVYSKIAAGLPILQDGPFGPESGAVGESRAVGASSVVHSPYHTSSRWCAALCGLLAYAALALFGASILLAMRRAA
jgi:hypothetical protein